MSGGAECGDFIHWKSPLLRKSPWFGITVKGEGSFNGKIQKIISQPFGNPIAYTDWSSLF